MGPPPFRQRRDPAPLIAAMFAGVPLAILGGFVSQWWHPALWIGVAGTVPALLGALYAMAGLTMIARRAQFWTGGIAVGALLGLLFAEGEPVGALAGALTFGAARLYAEAVTWVLVRFGYSDPLDG